MKQLAPILAIVVLCACNSSTQQNKDYMKIPPPTVEKKPKELVAHGDVRIDNYYWLNERDNPAVLRYLEAENAYVDTVMSHTKHLQEKLFNEMKGRIKETDESVPTFDNGYYLYARYEKGKEYPIHCRKKGTLEAPEEVILDVNELAEGHEFFSVAGLKVSPDNQVLAYAVDDVGRRRYKIHFKNLETGETYPVALPEATGNLVWANDNKTLYYVTKDTATLRSDRVKQHILGQTAEQDKNVYFEDDSTYSVYLSKTRSKKFLVINSESTLSSEARILPADKPGLNFTVFQPRQKDMLYYLDHKEGQFYVQTNWEAKNFRLMVCQENQTAKSNWKDLIPHRDDVLLEEFLLFKDYLVLQERKRGLIQLRIINSNSQQEHYIDFGEPAYVAMIYGNPEYDTKLLRYSYASMVTPNSTFDYNMETRAKELKKQQEVLGGYDPKNYTTERLYAKAKDGTEVPISIVYKKGFHKDGNGPLLLYGYGSYGNSTEAGFNSNRISLLDRGFAYAIAHIRGGQEMGRQWYEDGKMFKKKNTFTDFIDCADYLIANKYTSSNHLYALGGSAGGLLIGAVINMRPELWHGVIAAVPFVDVVTTMLDASIPLTTSEYDEWGNPNNKDSYDYMKSYSPYDNVKAQNYPNILVTTGLHDSQVQYFEPAKWVAKLREMKTDQHLLLFKINMDAGHGGASGRFKALKEVALQYAFFLDLEGITK
ncbi:oligopeptidase B [Chitinophaga caeni]|uniref:Proline-specific endopeptidase n=2 Tax=Chitinophaga caeni TaxID=2029983 RepID=A0A291R055_9BACT|nr:oligopeptidase B [Chitinophaga caeni]